MSIGGGDLGGIFAWSNRNWKPRKKIQNKFQKNVNWGIGDLDGSFYMRSKNKIKQLGGWGFGTEAFTRVKPQVKTKFIFVLYIGFFSSTLQLKK